MFLYIKLFLIVTHFVNSKHSKQSNITDFMLCYSYSDDFPKEIETFFQKEVNTIPGEKLEDASVFVRIAISYPWLVNN